jgi:AcrR family transcriptional regulator
MTSLRERKKADKERRILEAATRLFREQGYDHARMEHIADMAEVSVGTLYNYYENKGDILMATVNMEVTEVLDAGEAIVADPPADVEQAVNRLVDQYYDHSLFYLSKEMWRAAMAISIQQPDTPLSKAYTELDQRLSAQMVRLIETLQARRLVGEFVSAQAVGEVLFNNLNMMFIEFVKDEPQPLAVLKARAAEQHGPIARLITGEKTATASATR